MRAVIMAGGEGSRLRPLSLGHPKPMTSLVGRPVLEHIINLLKSPGITRLCITLCHHPEEIMGYFGDGNKFGVSITYFTEERPLGTAGSVKACMDWLGGEDFLVLGGDCICDLDLSTAILHHGEKKGVATLLLHPHKTPLEYGIVHLDTKGRVTRFLEKPTWGQVMTNLVNTGIYILSNEAMERVPVGEIYDFGKDLFPKLLTEGRELYGEVVEGYWRDIGDCQSYLDCCADVLHGKVKLEMGAPKVGRGIWANSHIPPDVTIVAPCFIGENVTLKSHSLVGPHVVVEDGCSIGENAMIQRSVLQRGSRIERDATAYGAILCPDAHVGVGAVLHRGAVLGEGARGERGSTIMEGVRLWPHRCAPRGERVTHSLTGQLRHSPLTFGDGGIIRGTLGEDLDVRQMMVLGGLLAGRGEVLLGYTGGNGARILSQACASGVGSAGGEVAFHRLQSPAQSGWLAGERKAAAALFVEQEGERCYLHLVGEEGLPLHTSVLRELERGLALGDIPRVSAEGMGGVTALSVSEREYVRSIASRAPLYRILLHPVTLGVVGESAGDQALRHALVSMGCTVLRGWRQGIPTLSTCHGGTRLVARDEEGTEVDRGQLLGLITLIEMENGDRRVAVPPAHSSVVELVARGFGGEALRLGRDGREAEALYGKLPWLRDGAFAGARIASRMAVTGERLRDMLQKIPRLSVHRKEVPLSAGRGQVMEKLMGEENLRNDGGEGVRIHSRGGWVYLAPLSRRAALQVVAEGADMELSAELCDQFATRIRGIDGACCEQDS